MRELTVYEKKKWFDKYDRFEIPEFLEEGTEFSEFMHTLAHLVEMGSSYGMSDEFEKFAQIEYLDRYYDEIYHTYTGEWGMEPDEHGLPPIEEVKRRQDRAMELGVDKLTAVRMACDWAMRWKNEHYMETFKKQRKEALQRELAALGE